MIDLAKIQDEVSQWSNANFQPRSPMGTHSLLGVMEEVGELAHAHLKMVQQIRVNENHHANRIDAIGDIIIYLCDYCTDNAIDLEFAINVTWSKVSQRDWTKNRETGEIAK